MTPMSVLPDHAVAGMLPRPTPQNSGDNAGSDQAKKFLELLSQLTGQQAAVQPVSVQAQGKGKDGVAEGGHPSPTWKFRMTEGALSNAASNSSAEATMPQPMPPVGDAALVTEQGEGSVATIVRNGLDGVPNSEAGKDADPENTEALPIDQTAVVPVQQSSGGTDVVLPGQMLAPSEGIARTGAMVSDARMAAELNARRAGQSPKIDGASAARLGTDDAGAISTVGDDTSVAALDLSSVEIGSAKRHDGPPLVVAEAKVTVVRSETHLPASGHMLPMQQIAERIETELAAMDSGDFSVDLASLPRTGTKPEGVVKILQIQLQPADMGTVTVRMSLRNDVLEVQLDASLQDTAHLLRQDREALSKVLQSAGYVLDGLAVHAVEPDRTAATLQLGVQPNHAATQSSAHSQPNWSQPDGRPSDMQREAQRDGRHPYAQAESGAAPANAGRTSSNSGIYL